VRRRWIIVAGIVLVAAAGTAIAIRARKPKPVHVTAAPPPMVATESNLTGRVAPRTVVSVGAPMEGVIDAYFLDVNQPVYKDQLLGRIHNPDAEKTVEQAQLALDTAQTRVTTLSGEQLAAKLEVSRTEAEQSRARNDLERLEKNYQKQKGLWDVGATPRLTFENAEKDYKDAKEAIDKQAAAAKDAEARATQTAADLDAANAAVEKANSALERAKADLTKGEIHSPADGIIIARKGAPNDPVDLNSKDLFQIATDLTQLQITLTPTPAELARIHAGQAVAIRVPEFSPDEIPGIVRGVSASQITIEFSSPSPATKLDLVAQAKIKF
jgi:multidrug resistance efflux pump